MSLVATLFAGVMTWSLLEYFIHRFAGHGRFARIKWNPFGVEHTAHHSKGDYFAPESKKALSAVIFTAALGAPAVLLLGTELGIAYVVGFVGFYLTYEIFHRLEHVWAGVGPYARWARKHHFYHHFHNPEANHGVTSPIWDIVFGTYEPTGVIQVPEKMAMRWLVDPETGDVREELKADYALRRRKVRAAAQGSVPFGGSVGEKVCGKLDRRYPAPITR